MPNIWKRIMLDGIKYYFERVWLVYILGDMFLYFHTHSILSNILFPPSFHLTIIRSPKPLHPRTHQNVNFLFILVYLYFIIIISIHTFSVSLNIFHKIYNFLFYFKTCTYICIFCRTLHSTSISFSLHSLS